LSFKGEKAVGELKSGLRSVGVILVGERWDLFLMLLKTKEGRKGSTRLREIIEEEIVRLQGRPTNPKETMGYAELKSNHAKLVKEVDNLEKQIRKQKVYDQLEELAGKVGLDFDDFKNIDQVAPKLLKEWKQQDLGGSLIPLPEHMHQFITLIELARDKREIEAKLTEIRLSGKPGKAALTQVNA
jgi:hypothetical protein